MIASWIFFHSRLKRGQMLLLLYGSLAREIGHHQRLGKFVDFYFFKNRRVKEFLERFFSRKSIRGKLLIYSGLH